MEPYAPESRRPIAGVFRRAADGITQFCVRNRISPDAVSYMSIVFSAIAGLCFWQSQNVPELLLIGPLFCYLRLYCNMLDGMVALAGGTASYRGEVVNEVPDRVSDTIIFVGVAHSGFCHPLGAYWVIIAMLFVSYIGVLGQAVKAQREYGGIMAKPYRMVLLHLGAWTTYFLFRFTPEHTVHLGPLTVLDWTHILILAGCVQTFGVRLQRILRTLRLKAQSPA